MKLFLSIPLLALTFLVTGCGDDNPVDPDEGDQTHDEDAVGVLLRQSGEEIARYENGEVEGRVAIGENKQTPLLTTRFIAEDGDLYVPENEDFSLDWEIADPEIAEVVHHEEDGKWRFHIVGKEEGTTTIRVKLNHNDHADFVSLPIEIEVIHDGPGEEVEEGDQDHEDDHAEEG